MNVELADLMADLADEAAAACVAGSCALATRADGDWHDTTTLRGAASAAEFQRALRYLRLRGRAFHRQGESSLVRIIDSGVRPPAEADTTGEPDLLFLARRYAWAFAQYVIHNTTGTKAAAERSFSMLAAAASRQGESHEHLA